MKDKKSNNLAIHVVVWVAIVALAYLPFKGGTSSSQDDYPRKPIEIVVPFKAGGGSDVLVRMFQKVINKKELLPVPLVVVNRPGASATDGSRFVKDTDADGYTILNLHDAIIISKHFGNVDYGPEAFEPIAGTAITDMVIVVREDSPYKDLNAFIADAKERPSQIIMGCSLGTPTHVAGLLIEKEAEVKFNLIQSGGGAARLEQLMGKHIHASPYSVAEYLNFKSQGLKALAFMGEKRHPDLPDIPTLKESGIDAVFDVMQYWWFPKGTDAKKAEIISTAFKKAMQEEELKAFLAKNRFTPVMMTGEELQQRIQKVENKISSLKADKAHDLPPFHLIVMGTLALFFVYILFDNMKKKGSKPAVAKEPLNFMPAVFTIAILAVYIFLMSTGIIDFRILTFVFMMGLGLFLGGKQAINKAILIECALMISLGTYYVFTNIVHVDLP